MSIYQAIWNSVSGGGGGGGGGGITNLNGLTGASQTFSIVSTGTDFVITSSGTDHQFAIPSSSAANRGLLSSADWTTFNGKQAALGYTAADDSLVVHLAGTETISGEKSFNNLTQVYKTTTNTLNEDDTFKVIRSVENTAAVDGQFAYATSNAVTVTDSGFAHDNSGYVGSASTITWDVDVASAAVQMMGSQSYSSITGDATVLNAVGLSAGVVNESTAGTITNAVGVLSEVALDSGTAITTGYNFKTSLNDATTKYGFFNDITGSVDRFENVTVAGTCTLSTMTAGSVLFAGTAGLVSQDNSNLFFDDTNNVLIAGHNTAIDTSTRFNARGTTAAAGSMSVGHSLATGYSAISFFSSAGSFKGSLGYANASVGTLTPDSYYFRADGMSYLWYQSTTEVMRLTTTGRLGIGEASPDSPLHVTAASATSAYNLATFENTDNTGTNGFVINLITGSITSTIAARRDRLEFGNGGVQTFIRSSSAAYTGLLIHTDNTAVFGSGTSRSAQVSVTVVTASNVGLQVRSHASQTANLFEITNSSGTVQSAFNSSASLAVRATAATAYLHIGAGTATANTAPLKLTSGTSLTTAEAGAFEYNGTDLFFTKSGTTRGNVLVATAVTTEVVVSDTTLTITYNGTTYKLLAIA